MSTVPTAPLGDATVAPSSNAWDRARVELVRGGRAHAMPCTDHHAEISVVVIATDTVTLPVAGNLSYSGAQIPGVTLSTGEKIYTPLTPNGEKLNVQDPQAVGSALGTS